MGAGYMARQSVSSQNQTQLNSQSVLSETEYLYLYL